MAIPLSIDDQVKAFVAEVACRAPDEIRADATLLGDVGLDGDDANEFLAQFANRFEVDMNGFSFSEHFGPEGIYPWQFPRFVWNLVSSIWSTKDIHEVAGLKPVRIADLILAAKAKKWSVIGHS
jgi:hypothetical protein